MTLRTSSPIPISLTAPAPGGSADTPLAVPYRTQKPFSNLCWAACCQMVFQYYGRAVELCEVAASVYGNHCCSNLSSCDRPTWPDTVYSQPVWRFNCRRVDQPLTFGNIEFEIDAKRPIHAYYVWSGGGSHLAVVSGYYSNGDIEVLDPMFGQGRLSYQYVFRAYGHGAWSKSYFALEPRGD